MSSEGWIKETRKVKKFRWAKMIWEDDSHKVYYRHNKTHCVIFYDNSATAEDRTHNNMNEVTDIEGTTHTYDDNGNLTDDGTYEYEYDALNRLIKVLKKGEPDITVGEYAYDALNRRIWREADEDNDGDTDVDMMYFYDGWQVVEERDYSDQGLLKDYVYGAIYIDEPIYGRSDNNDDGDFLDSEEKFYYTHNNLYNIATLLDTSGNIIEAYEYLPYGDATIYTEDGNDDTWFTADDTTGSLTGNYYLFTGRRYDPESGLYYYRRRYYSDYLARFLQRDPRRDVNLYWYCADNPINFTDPGGKDLIDLIWTGKWSPSPEESAAAYGALAETFGGHDVQVEAGLLVAVGTIEVTCTDDKCRTHKVVLKKRCAGVIAGVSASSHILANIKGKNCPHAYEGFFFEWAAGMPGAGPGVSGEIGIRTKRGERVKGAGAYIGIGPLPVQAMLCEYKIISDIIE